MTIVPMWKICPKCHKKYDWNPDVGNFNCPYCHGLGVPGGGLLDKVFRKKKTGDIARSENENEESD